jgi:hypothetical protein
MSYLTFKGLNTHKPDSLANINDTVPAFTGGPSGMWDFEGSQHMSNTGETNNKFIGWNYGLTGVGASAGYYDGILGSSTTNSGNTTPVPGNIYYRRMIIAYTISAASIATVISGAAGGFTISGLGWYQSRTVSASYSPLPNFAIAMCHMSGGTANTNSSSSTGRADFTTVLNQSNFDITATGKRRVAFNTNFNYNGTDALGIIYAWGQCPTNWTSNGPLCYTATTPGSVYYSRSDSTGTYVVTNSANSSTGTRPYFEFLLA